MRLIIDDHRHEERLGEADDVGAPFDALSFAQASVLAMEWGKRKKESLRVRTAADPITVERAVADYIAFRRGRDERNGKDAEHRIRKHLLADEKMALQPLASLTDKHWKTWRAGLEGLGVSSVRRLTNDVKAAMNRAWGEHHRELPARWRDMMVAGLIAPAANEDAETGHRDYLPEPDVRRIVSAAFEVNADFGYLVLVLAATGARFSQVKRLNVADVIEGAEPRLMVPPSRKGRQGSRKPKRITFQIGTDVLEVLASILAGRPGHERLLQRWHHEQFAGDKDEGRLPEWRPVRREPWTISSQMTRPWREMLTRAGLPPTIEPYRLRDASIIRMLREGVPLGLTASVHDTSEAIIRLHYASHIHDALGELARKAVVPLAPTEPVKPKVVARPRGQI